MTTQLKYKITNETIRFYGKTLYRIEALKDFGDVKAGDKGGYVEKESNLSHDGDAWVSEKALVYGNALVGGDALVSGDAIISEDALVYGNALVGGSTWVYGNARLSAKANFTKGAFVGGDESEEPTFAEITDQTGSTYWRHQYVIGEYEITPIEDEPAEKPQETITLDGKTYRLVEEL